MMREKPEVGQILYSLNVGNAAHNRTQELTKVVVVMVGRKYFYCCPIGCENKHWMHRQYFLDDWSEKSNYSADSKLYKTELDWEIEKETDRLCKYIEGCFQYGNNRNKLPINAIRDIVTIIDLNKAD